MKFTAERLVPGIPRLENMIVEELSRLNFVRSHFEGKTVLDAGCGAGLGTVFMAESGAHWVLGVDISAETILHAAQQKRDNMAFEVTDCTHLALRDESFDMVCSLELIEHLAQTEQYLSEVCRVLGPEGYYFMSTPNQKVSSTADGRASWAFHEREFTYDELGQLLGAYFEHVEIWGSFVPVYEDHPIRKVTRSPLSQIKHMLPSRLRLWVSSSIRFWIKPELSFGDVVFTKSDIDEAPTFVALCTRKRV
jgi:ubiquinone/menaquinone biosynthesis C-methylase UbiE